MVHPGGHLGLQQGQSHPGELRNRPFCLISTSNAPLRTSTGHRSAAVTRNQGRPAVSFVSAITEAATAAVAFDLARKSRASSLFRLSRSRSGLLASFRTRQKHARSHGRFSLAFCRERGSKSRRLNSGVSSAIPRSCAFAVPALYEHRQNTNTKGRPVARPFPISQAARAAVTSPPLVDIETRRSFPSRVYSRTQTTHNRQSGSWVVIRGVPVVGVLARSCSRSCASRVYFEHAHTTARKTTRRSRGRQTPRPARQPARLPRCLRELSRLGPPRSVSSSVRVPVRVPCLACFAMQ